MRRGHFHQGEEGDEATFGFGDEGSLGVDGDGAHCKPVEGGFVYLPGKSSFGQAAQHADPSAFDNALKLRHPENSLPEKYLTASIHVKCEVLLSHIHNYKGAS